MVWKIRAQSSMIAKVTANMPSLAYNTNGYIMVVKKVSIIIAILAFYYLIGDSQYGHVEVIHGCSSEYIDHNVV